MRGGRKKAEGGAETSEGDLGQVVMVTVFTRVRTGAICGSPRNPQHEQIPLQVSGVTGSGWLT